MRRWIWICSLLVTLTGCWSGEDADGGDGGTPGGSAVQYCERFWGEVCTRAFGDCHAELVDLAEQYVDQQECRADTDCPASAFEGLRYDAVAANSCLTGFRAMTCAELIGSGTPQVCERVITPEPPSRTGCTSLSVGTSGGSLESTDPVLASWGHYDNFCLPLRAGNTVIITTSPGTGVPVEDTVLLLYDPSGSLVAQNDDGPYDLYSYLALEVPSTGSYLLLVAGYDPGELGAYAVTVQLQ